MQKPNRDIKDTFTLNMQWGLFRYLIGMKLFYVLLFFSVTMWQSTSYRVALTHPLPVR